MTYAQRHEEILKTKIIPQTKEEDFEELENALNYIEDNLWGEVYGT